jgi:tRNA-binding protein
MTISPVITFDDVLKLDIRVGTVVEAEPFPQARKPAIKLVIDFGAEVGRKTSSAQIVTNHPIGPFESQVLTLGVPDANGAVMLIRPDRAVPEGGRLY